MFGKKKMVKITEEKLQWLGEKVKERQEYKKDAQVAKWNLDIAQRALRMEPKDWNTYYDFVKYHWYFTDAAAKEKELEFAEKMAQLSRSEEGYAAFTQFIKELHDLEFYSQERKEKK